MGTFLTTVDPFASLSTHERHRVAASAMERSYRKGETIFREGEQSDAVWVVKTGRVHLLRFRSDGKVSTSCVMTPKETFCCLPALDRKTYPADAVAAEDSVVVRVPAETFHQCIQQSPAFMKQTLCLFCDRLREVEHQSCMLYESADERLARVLLGLSKKFGNTIPLTRQELAEIAGITHETAIRALSRFKAEGLIRSARGTTTILKSDQLQATLD